MKVWIGTLESSVRLVEEVERILRSQGHSVSWRSYGESPNRAKLAELSAAAVRAHHVVVCLFEPMQEGEISAEIKRGTAESSSIRLPPGPDAAFTLAAAIIGKRAAGSHNGIDGEGNAHGPN
jgi:hypothetical protein